MKLSFTFGPALWEGSPSLHTAGPGLPGRGAASTPPFSHRETAPALTATQAVSPCLPRAVTPLPVPPVGSFSSTEPP